MFTGEPLAEDFWWERVLWPGLSLTMLGFVPRSLESDHSGATDWTGACRHKMSLTKRGQGVSVSTSEAAKCLDQT